MNAPKPTRIETKWLGGVRFTNSQIFPTGLKDSPPNESLPPTTMFMDGPESIGGKSQGLRPMALMLGALGGCTGVDLVLLLKKARQQLDAMNITIDGHRRTEAPALYEKIHLHFELQGEIAPKVAHRLITLSLEKHCSAALTLKAAGAEITHSIAINTSADL